jgi:hypothetical protein
MKNLLLLTLIFSLALTACGASTTPTSSVNAETYISPNLDTSYENALSTRLQLTLGSLKLVETNYPITREQAQVMLPLWQVLINMTQAGNSAQAEVNAVLGQIEATFTPDQLTSIRAMKLVSTDIQAWASANGVTLGSGSGQAGSGQGSGISPEARATKQAAEGITSGSNGGSGVSTVMLNTLISYLQNLSQ